MSEHLHPGLHPDPDSLSAFIEGMLPEHERLQCLAHLAECSQCREVVYLAQEPTPVPAADPAPTWRRWFAPVPVLAAAAAACIVVVPAAWYLHHKGTAPARDIVARANPAPPVPAPISDLRPNAVAPPPVTQKTQPRTGLGTARASRGPATETNPRSASRPAFYPPAVIGTVRTLPLPPLPSLPAPPSIQVSAQSELIQNQPPPALLSSLPLPLAPPSVNIKDDRASADGPSGISGTITDASGAAVPGASINLRQPASALSRDTQTDMAGQFRLTGLPAGRYELQISAPGFQRTLRQVEVRPLELASVSSVLQVGSVSESVEVTAAVPTLQTSSASTRSVPQRKTATPSEPRPLPSNLPADITVTRGKVMLTVDSEGALFLSRNAGRSWKAVKAVRPGKVTDLILTDPAQTPAAVFQLTTNSDAVWLSRDGSHWYPAPPRR